MAALEQFSHKVAARASSRPDYEHIHRFTHSSITTLDYRMLRDEGHLGS